MAAFTSKLYRNELVIDESTPMSKVLPPDGRGRGLHLDLRETPFGKMANAPAPPPDFLIPRSEWQARIQEMEEKKSRVSDLCTLAGLKCKDQQQTNYCATEDTEVLTDRGWVGWPDYNGKDLLGTVDVPSGRLEFQAPIAIHAYEHDGPMIYSTHRSLDFGVTPDHRMLVRRWDERRRTLSDSYTFQRAGDLGWYCGLMHAPSGFIGTDLIAVKIEGDREYDGDDFVAMVSLVVSDGYAGGTEKTRNWVSFACFRQDRLETVRALAARIGFREKQSNPGVFIRYDAGALAAWFRSNAYVSPELGAQNKMVPGLVKEACARQILHFLQVYGDQSHDRGNHYFSTSKRAIDDIQELLLRVGQRGSIWAEEREGKVGVLDDGKRVTSRRRMYHLHVRSSQELSIQKKQNIEVERYKGPVYCATVPNGTLITRRNGSVLISGNCWINAPTYCVEVMRVLQGQNLIYFSPASAGGPIKGFRNVGGWGEEGLAYIVANGLVPVDLWPANAIDPRYNTPANRKVAMKYRVTEWYELQPRNYDQMISLLLRRIPGAGGYNWQSHETTLVEPVWLDGVACTRNRNSWGMGYGSQGYFILQGSRMLADDLVAPRVVTASRNPVGPPPKTPKKKAA